MGRDLVGIAFAFAFACDWGRGWSVFSNQSKKDSTLKYLTQSRTTLDKLKSKLSLG